MIRRSTLIAVEIVLALVAALAIGLGLAWWRLAQGPMELGFIREQIQTELSAARAGRPVRLERVELGLSRSSTALELRAVGVTVQDARGQVLSRSDEARIELSLLPLLVGRIAVERAEFSGGAVTLTRKPDGAFEIAFGPEGAPPDIIVPPPPPDETMEQRVTRVLDALAAAFRPVGAGGGLKTLSVRGARLAIVDEGGGGRWTADAASIELARRGATLALVAEARLEGASGAAPANLRVTTDTRFQTAVIEFGARQARPRALLSPAALGPFAGLDAPLTANISIGLDRRRGVTQFEGEADIGRGSADMAGGRFSLDGGRVHGRYDVAADELVIDELGLAGERTRVRGAMRIRGASSIFAAAPDQPAAFNIELPSLTLDVPGTFAQPIALSEVRAVGAIKGGEHAIELTQLSARAGEGRINARARLYWAPVGPEQRMRTGLQLEGDISGAVTLRQVTSMWPMNLAPNTRAYLARALTGGQVANAHARLDIRPGEFGGGGLRQEAVDVRFDVVDGQMRFISTMSPVTGVSGSAILRGNSFEMDVPRASINGLALTNGRIEAPRFKPPGGMLTISARANGGAREIVELLMQEPLDLSDRLPIQAASVSGRASVNLRLQRPIARDVRFEDWRFSLDGAVRDFAGAMSTRRVALSHGQLTVRGDQRAITVSGPIHAGQSQIQQVSWTERLNQRGQGSSEYQISGDFAADDLERLGYPIARSAQGRIGVTVSGAGRGFDVDNARVDLDLTRAAVEAPRMFWTKRAGQSASASFVVRRQRDGGLLFDAIDARGVGMRAQGRVRLARDGSIAEADLPRILIEGRSDARLTAARPGDGGLDVAVRGALFDAAPFMGGDERAQTREPDASAPAPMRVSVIVDRLKMRGGATLADARVNLALARGALAMLTAEGAAPGGRAFSLGLGVRPGEPAGRIVFSAEDAGFAVRALTGSENVVGGRVNADGDWRAGPPSTARFNVHMRDFQVVRLPAMARLLSSAGSLTGLVQTLNGDGIGFSSMDAQMAYANDRLSFTEGSMRGPSMGLTASGAYDIHRDNLDIDGVVAPSPMLNLSALGSVPVLGDLLVSRRGEGVVGMTYSINGRAGEPRVGVNPLSALTPGILRRIFEPAQRPAPAPEQPAAPAPPEAEAAPASAAPAAPAPGELAAALP